MFNRNQSQNMFNNGGQPQLGTGAQQQSYSLGNIQRPAPSQFNQTGFNNMNKQVYQNAAPQAAFQQPMSRDNYMARSSMQNKRGAMDYQRMMMERARRRQQMQMMRQQQQQYGGMPY